MDAQPRAAPQQPPDRERRHRKLRRPDEELVAVGERCAERVDSSGLRGGIPLYPLDHDVQVVSAGSYDHREVGGFRENMVRRAIVENLTFS